VQWNEPRKLFTASTEAGKKGREFRVEVLGVQVALARAIMLAGHKELLSKLPWLAATKDAQRWCDRHRPTSIYDLAGYGTSAAKAWKNLQTWLEDRRDDTNNGKAVGSSSDSFAHAAIVSGPRGVGKTSGAELLAQLTGLQVKKYDLDEPHGVKYLDEVIKRQSQIGGKGSVAILRYPTDDPSTNLQEKICRAIRVAHCPMIFIVKDEKTLRRGFKSLCHLCTIRLTATQQERALREIAEREGLDGKNVPLAVHNGDLRTALINLQFFGSTDGQTNVRRELAASAACSRLLTMSCAANGTAGFDTKEASRLLAKPSVARLVKDNYFEVCDQPKGLAGLSDCAAAAEALVDASINSKGAPGKRPQDLLLMKSFYTLPCSTSFEAPTLQIKHRQPKAVSEAIASLCQKYELPRTAIQEQVRHWYASQPNGHEFCAKQFNAWLSDKWDRCERPGSQGCQWARHAADVANAAKSGISG
jgi:hypothetical protein